MKWLGKPWKHIIKLLPPLLPQSLLAAGFALQPAYNAQDAHTVQREEQKNPSCMKCSTVQQHAVLSQGSRERPVQLLSGVVVCSYYLEFWLMMTINNAGQKREFSYENW